LRRRKTRTRRLEVGAALAAALSLSACGGAKHSAPPPPTLSSSLASSLAAQSDAVAGALASGDSCRAQTLARGLQARTIAAINQGRVEPRLQEQLSSAVNALAARVRCVPPPPAPRIREQKHPEKHGHGKHKGHDKHDGND
jgi:hypothetical protein